IISISGGSQRVELVQRCSGAIRLMLLQLQKLDALSALQILALEPGQLLISRLLEGLLRGSFRVSLLCGLFLTTSGHSEDRLLLLCLALVGSFELLLQHWAFVPMVFAIGRGARFRSAIFTI